MCKVFLLLLLSFLDAGTAEKLVVVDHVDMVEVNHKYFTDSDTGEVKKQFVQVIFWEYRKNVLLPEIKDGELTGNWYQGSDYVVIDYFTFNNQNYGLNKVNGIAPYLYRDKWYTHYYDQSDKCERIVVAKQIKKTSSFTDPEVLNARIVQTSSRKELTKPDRYVRIKKIPKEIEDLLDKVIEVK
jgi:hypothetical protein